MVKRRDSFGVEICYVPFGAQSVMLLKEAAEFVKNILKPCGPEIVTCLDKTTSVFVQTPPNKLSLGLLLGR